MTEFEGNNDSTGSVQAPADSDAGGLDELPRYNAITGRAGGETVYVRTKEIEEAVSGNEAAVLSYLGINYASSRRDHIDCPYPSHGGKRDWRFDFKKGKAHCTCSTSHSIFEVVGRHQGIEFEEAKVKVADIIGRHDLKQSKGSNRLLATISLPQALLSPPIDRRDDRLVSAYLAHRLNVSVPELLMPSTGSAGWKEYPYYEAGPKKLGEYPCAMFEMTDAAGGSHVHRIYTAQGGAGKADLGRDSSGAARPAKKLAKAPAGTMVSGMAVIWGNPNLAARLILAEGIETGAAVAMAFRSEIAGGRTYVAAAITAGGMENFRPWPATTTVIVAADRDESAKDGRKPSLRGEEAALEFCKRNAATESLELHIALPGIRGESTDWLDAFLANGAAAVMRDILAAAPFNRQVDAILQTATTQVPNEIRAVSKKYPLPEVQSPRLSYEPTPAGEIWVHKHVVSKGVFETVSVCTPLSAVARLRRLDSNDAYGLRVNIMDMDGTSRSIDIDRGALAELGGSRIKARLFDCGLRTEADGDSIALQILKSCKPEQEIAIVNRPGWRAATLDNGLIFVCPNGSVLGLEDANSVELAQAVRISQKNASAGTLDGWKAVIATAVGVAGCEHWQLGLLCAFAGPLIALCGLDSCGINFSGRTSAGKTTAQRIAVSAWSRAASHESDSLLKSARTTANAVERIAESASSTVLALDELSHLDSKQLRSLIYMLAGGSGKHRMNSDSEARKPISWSTFALLSAENSIFEQVTKDGGQFSPGMAVRFLDIDVTGVNRNVPSDVMRAIETGLDSHFGWGGEAFVAGVIERGIHRDPGTLRAGIMEIASAIAGPDADSSLRRAAVPFAILQMAGEIAQACELIPGSMSVANVIAWGLERFKSSQERATLDPATFAIDQLRTWVAERWDTSIRATNCELNHRDSVGWYDKDAVYITKSRLSEAAGGGLKEIEVARHLDNLGFIAKRKDSDHRFVAYVPSVGKVPAYALRRGEFGRERSGTNSYLKARDDE